MHAATDTIGRNFYFLQSEAREHAPTAPISGNLIVSPIRDKCAQCHLFLGVNTEYGRFTRVLTGRHYAKIYLN